MRDTIFCRYCNILRPFSTNRTMGLVGTEMKLVVTTGKIEQRKYQMETEPLSNSGSSLCRSWLLNPKCKHVQVLCHVHSCVIQLYRSLCRLIQDVKL